jgi:phosphoribosyl 1,2-cyclic phosphate phosphodiesterase
MKTKLLFFFFLSSIGVPTIVGHWGNCKKNNKKNIRTRSSVIIFKGTNSILIDTSPDLRNQLLSNNIKNISSVILTHEHADQINGLFELRPFFWKYKKKINIYGDRRTINLVRKRDDYLFKKISTYPPIVKSNIIKSRFSLGKKNEKVFFKSNKVKHGEIKSLALIFEKTAYISDTNDLTITKIKGLKNLKYLIIDCLKFKKHPTHFNLNESLYVHQSLKPKTTILTNLHHDLDYNYLSKTLPSDVIPAYDGLKINL